MPWFPNKPPVNSPADDFSFKRWFQDVWRFIRGENRANLTLTTATNLSEDFFYPVDCTSGAVTVTLPLAAEYQYKKFCIKKTDSSANAVTVARSGSDTIDGATSTTLTSQYDAVVVLSNGVATWHKINSTGGGTATVDFDGAVWLTMIGGGGGGAAATGAGSPGGGGGSGESTESTLIKVTPGASYSYSVGAGGAANTNGGDTYFDVYYCRGGKGAISGVGGQGGGSRGGTGGAVGGPGATGNQGTAESATFFGGSGGGGAGSSTTNNGGPGGGSGGHLVGGLGGAAGGGNGGGGGGGASIYGKGGAGGAGGAGGSSATSTWYGSGGGGGGGAAGAGGSGAGGYILLAWVGGAQIYTSGSGTWTAPN